MQSAIIYVFSGTKHTLLTAKMAKASFDRLGVSTTVFEVRRPFVNVPSPNDFDYAGFAYPVHAFNSPQIFLQFVKMLPDSNIKAFIIKTSGEPFHINDASSHSLYRMLTKKGFDVTLDLHLLMPYNIVFRYKDELAKQMHIYSQKMCEMLASDFLDGKRSKFKFKPRHRIASAFFRIQWIGAKLNGRIYTTDKKKCNNCMLCVNQCPTKNISFKNGKICFDGQCAMCMRCVMFCPKDAVYPGILRLWKVNGAYEFNRLIRDDSIKSDFVNENTKGYFRFFKKYYRKADAQIMQANERSEEQEDLEISM